MNSLKTSLLSRLIAAAAVATCGLAVPAVSHAIAAGTPSGGLICRAGYAGDFNGASFKCSKAVVITVVLECNNPTFPTYVVRAPGAPGTPEGKDICTRNNGVQVGSTDSVVNLVRGPSGDYVFAAVNPATVANRVTNVDQSEAAALGVQVGEVDTVAGEPVIADNGGVGSKANARVTLTHFTFAIPNRGPIILGGPLSTAR
jgi:hypothetical protein